MKLSSILATCLLALPALAHAADPVYVSEPRRMATQKVSMAASPRAYRLDAARHVYEAYAPRIFKGRLPPLIHAVVVVETAVDAGGRPLEVKLVRGPSHAPDVSAAVIEMIHRAGPLPAPASGQGFRWIEIWLVHKDGRFQLDALTEGQD